MQTVDVNYEIIITIIIIIISCEVQKPEKCVSGDAYNVISLGCIPTFHPFELPRMLQ